MDAAPDDPKAILTRAFVNQYDVDIRSDIELRMKNDSGQDRTRRKARAETKRDVDQDQERCEAERLQSIVA